MLPEAFDGDRNIVIVAFRREHQTLVDSWVPWLEEHAWNDAGLRFFEIPTIGRMSGTSAELHRRRHGRSHP